MGFVFRKMDVISALQIIAWEYPPPYEMYGMRNSTLALSKLISGDYLSVYKAKKLVGFFCFGSHAQLQTKVGHGLYQDNRYLDIGLGMHPDYCGQGLGTSFVRAGLEHAYNRQWRGGFRLTVASNNTRALTVYERLGFEKQGEIIWDARIAHVFLVLTLNKLGPAPKVGPFGSK